MTCLNKLKFFWSGEVNPEEKNVYKIDCTLKDSKDPRDVNDYMYSLYLKRSGRPHSGWYLVRTFSTRERAIAYYEQVKDLPIYLSD